MGVYMKTHTTPADEHETLISDLNKDSGEQEYIVKKNAALTLVLKTIHGKLIDSRVKIRLTGSGAQATIVGIVVGAGESAIRLHTMQSHEAPGTTSNLLIKTALSGNASCVIDGGIRVEKPAQKTDAYQRNENILLSDTAHAESKPSLEILANDVRCTHGATVGPVSENELWYLATRGISRKNARSLIVAGFFRKAVDLIESAVIKDSLWQSIEGAL